MNGKDGKPFKTRDGGVMRLETLIQEINDEMLRKITDNREVDEAEAKETARIVALAALKYGDLSNQARRIISLIWIDLLPLKEIQVLIFCIQLYVSSPFLQNTKNQELLLMRMPSRHL